MWVDYCKTFFNKHHNNSKLRNQQQGDERNRSNNSTLPEEKRQPKNPKRTVKEAESSKNAVTGSKMSMAHEDPEEKFIGEGNVAL